MFFSENGRTKVLIYLNLLILSISLNNLQSFILAERLFQHKFSLDYLQIPWLFLCAPFFYMFIINYLGIAKNKPKILKFVIPSFIVACFTQIIFVIITSKSANVNELELIYEIYITIEEIFIIISSVSIFIYSFYLLKNKEVLTSEILLYDDLKWLNFFLKLAFICYILWVIAITLKIHIGFLDFLHLYYPLRILTSIIIFWLGYQAIVHIQILKERKSIRLSLTKKTIKQDITKNTKEGIERDFEIIDSFIRNEKKFLEPKYTLKTLSNQLNFGAGRISKAINRSLDKSFIDYINDMRVDYAKNILTNPHFEKYTITSIGLESGFNSKSTFYTVFKKHTNMTPLAYRKEIL